MRVRIWIAGMDGPSRDFELVSPPRVGEGISISTERGIEDGIVANVMWQLGAIDRTGNAVTLGIEPVGSVTMVHVICRPPGPQQSLLRDQAFNDLAIEGNLAVDDPS